MPPALDNPAQRAADRRRADRRARRAARGRLDGRSGWRASASRAATSSASCGASPGCGSTTGRVSCPRSSRSATGWPRTCRSRRRRRSSTATTGSGNTMLAPSAPGPAGGDLRLGDGDDRRPAGRPRLHDDPLDPGRTTEVGKFNLQSVTRCPGFPTRQEMVAPLRGALRALDAGAQLVRDARAVEGDRVHGGQLQARGLRGHRRSVPEDVRRGGDRAGPARPRGHPHGF